MGRAWFYEWLELQWATNFYMFKYNIFSVGTQTKNKDLKGIS